MRLTDIPTKHIRAVFTDLDGTLSGLEGISAKTYEALFRLKEKGFWLVVVSGRPAGWADCLMRLWPLDVMIFENGAGITIREEGKLRTIGLDSEKNLAEQQDRLKQIFAELKQKIPHLKLATDQPFRFFDLAIDYKEEPPYLTPEELGWVMEGLKKNEGITTKLSSIHINYWCGAHTKVTACNHLITTEGRRKGISKDQIVFCGDSPNDEPLFEYFEHSVGVANVNHFLSQMKSTPRYLTQSEGGKGFCELIQHLLGSY